MTTPPPAVPARVVEAIDFMAEEIMCWGWESPGATKAKAALLAAIADAIEAAHQRGYEMGELAGAMVARLT